MPYHLVPRMLALLLVAAVLMSPIPPARAHGLEVDYSLTPVIALKIDLAVTDAAGEPLERADLAIYAPGTDDPWLRTTLGKAAALSVVPEVNLPGVWTVDVTKDDQTATLQLPLDFGAGYARIAPGAAITLVAQGAGVRYTVTEIVTVAVALDAAFEGGEALSEAQVAVYAPDNAKTPWLLGTADAAGHYAFVADITNAGTWEIQIRKAGHGEWVKIPLDADTVAAAEVTEDNASNTDSPSTELRIAGSTSASSEDGYSTAQIVLMSASVIWGLTGTALYFARRRDIPPAERE